MNKKFFLKILPLIILCSVAIGGMALIGSRKVIADPSTRLFYSSFDPKTFGDWSSAGENWHEDAGDAKCVDINNKKAWIKDTDDKQPEKNQLTKMISTAGYTNITLNWWYKIEKKLGKDDYVYLEWTNDGSTWNKIKTYNNQDKGDWTFDSYSSFPSTANNNPSFRFRFRGEGLKGASGEFWLDCVELEGISMPTCIDNDKDGYGSAGSTGCTYEGVDCDDSNSGVHPGATEVCNSIDDDCDGHIDGIYRSSDNQYGLCAGNRDVCYLGEWFPANGNYTPQDEICDGKDNDCDGLTDEDLIQQTTCGVGICSGNTGYKTCIAGTWVGDTCNPTYGAQTEICDGKLDEDCDGTVDEGCECTNGAILQCGPQTDVGECTYGTQTCTDGKWGECLGAINPSSEICDGKDNDCDGEIDENFNVGQSCTVGVGLCQATGTYVCTKDGSDTECNATAGTPTEEVCDNLDNNCNGEVDEGVKLTFYRDTDEDSYGNGEDSIQACSAPQGYVTDNRDCNDNNASIHPGATEVCSNQLDDDCDGKTDANDPDCYACTPNATQPCTTGQPGICSAGTQTCSAQGTWGECVQTNQRTTEICNNGLDDDCDGKTDTSDTDCQGSITGHKYNDLNKNGVYDEGELGLGGWTICIDGNKDGDCNDEGDSPTTTTSSDQSNLGLYGFSNIPIGTYQVCEIMKEGWTSKNNLCQTVEVTTGQPATADFFNYEIPTQTQKYTCNTSTWTCVAGETGDYDTEAACLSACKAPTGGGGGAGGGGGVYPPPQILVPQVLGAATEATEEGQGTETTISCGPYLLKFIKWGINNDPEEVKKLQAFLNEYLNLDLPLSGIYDQATYEAVKQFQLLLKDEVLTPWVNIGCLPSNATPTGYVYLTTIRAINNIVCPELHLPMPNLSSIQCVGGNIIGLGESGTVLGESTTTPETEITAPTTTEETEPTGTEATEAVEETTTSEETVSGGSQAWIWVLVGIIVIGGALYLIFFKKKK